MPQAPRKDNQVQRAQDKESKRARGALSCAECRRLKLKCDKTVPCSSCKRRGCSAICPNGSLITGQGTRFVLADTEVLHHKIAVMSDRIRQLEDALAILHSTISGSNAEPHPLLSRDLLKVKSSIELHSASVGSAVVPEEARNRTPADEDNEVEEPELHDTFGTLAIRDDGVATFYGRSAGSESLLIGEAAAAATASANTPPADSPHTNSNSLSPSLAHYPDYAGPSSSRHTPTHPRHAYPGPPSSSMDASVAALAASFPLAPTLAVSPSSVLSSPTSYSSSSFVNVLHQPPPATAPIQVPIHNLDVDILITHYLPAYEHAQALMRSYLELAPWFFGAVTRTQIEREIMPLWYPAETSSSFFPETSPASASTSPHPGGSVPPPPTSNISPAAASQGFPVAASAGAVARRQRTAHDLALLFVLCCFGALNDSSLPPAPDNAPAERYYQLTKAALSLDPARGPSASAGSDSAAGHSTGRYESVGGTEAKMPRNGLLERPPSVATVQTLSLMAIYEGMCSGENSIETTWALMGLAGKLAQSIGLHRDCARWKLSPGEVQKRRALFWELFITDCWQSLATGRLATFSLPFVDCELPADPDQSLAEDGSTVPSFPFWKARFGAECVAAVVQGTLTSRAPKYAIILDLDRKVRDMELPAYAHGEPPQGTGLAKTMEHFMPHNYRELTLLYIHRCFFAHAISSHPLDPVKSQYAPSFLAGYRSACTIVGSVKQQFNLFPIQIARFWVLWTHAFSASVMLASVATNSSRSKIAPAALLELNMACDLFARASGYGGRSAKFLPILRRLQAKAQNAFREANSAQPPPIPNDIFRPSVDPDTKDELSIFGGKTNTINTVAPGPASASSSKLVLRGAPRDGRGSDRASSDSPGQIFADNPQFSGVHSSLVEELHDFQGQIRVQIQNAYRTGTDLFLGAPMVVDSDEPSRSAVGGHGRQQQQQAPQFPSHTEVREREMVEKEREEMERERLERAHEHEMEMQRQYEQQQQQQQQFNLQQQEQQRQAHYQQQVETQRLDQERQQQQSYQEEHEVQYHHHHTFEPAEQSLYSSSSSTHTRPQRQAHAAPAQRQSSHPQSPPVVPSQAPYQDYRHSLSTPQADHMPANSEHHNHRHQHIYPSTQHHTPQHHAHLHQHQAAYPVSAGYEHAAVHAQSHVPGPSTAYSSGSSMTDAHHGHHHGYAHHTLHSAAPAAHAYGSEVQETFKYWPAASSSFAMPDQQSTTTKYVDVHYQHQYTPENALRGIAAEDRGLQETWQSYMEKVGSPRQFFED